MNAIMLAASSIPIVSTHHCDIPEVTRDGSTGLLAPERDVDSLVNHLRWLVHHPAEWNGMLDTGRRYVENEFDAPTQGERLGALYREASP